MRQALKRRKNQRKLEGFFCSSIVGVPTQLQLPINLCSLVKAVGWLALPAPRKKCSLLMLWHVFLGWIAPMVFGLWSFNFLNLWAGQPHLPSIFGLDSPTYTQSLGWIAPLTLNLWAGQPLKLIQSQGCIAPVYICMIIYIYIYIYVYIIIITIYLLYIYIYIYLY